MKKGSDTPIDNQDWKTKYFDSLGSLENEQRQFRAMESSLKRLAGRLCTASLGQSSQLDEEIKKLQLAIRREATSDELDQITPLLTEAINALDQSATAPPPVVPVVTQPTTARPTDAQSVLRETPDHSVAGDERMRSILSALLAELRRDAELIRKVDELDSKLAISLTRDQLPEVLSSITDLVVQRIHRIERAKQEIEILLSHMVGKLDEISRFVADQNQNQSQSFASSQSLSTQLVGEMNAMGESVDSAVDVQQIRTQVRSRLDSIGKHLQEFRQREVTRDSTIRARNEQMQARVAELEAEANRLHNQLKDEQRLSTIDTLTKVPNRLSYEKRIDEEMKRWQRFKQPTCIAVWDVDHFKNINDTYGHRAGDRVLHAVAECLARRIRGTDFIARYGGEEFVMILCGIKLDDAMRLTDEMRVAIEKLALHFRGTPISITISCGVTTLLTGDTSAAAFDRADKAMYRAKEGGRNRCVSG